MTSAEQIASNYIATWNAADTADRAELIAGHWSAEPRYVDPLIAAKGAEELSGIIGALQDRFPGFRFTLINTPDGHGDYVRFAWGLGPDGGEPIIEGSDVIVLKDGKMAEVVGFLDKMPAAI